MGTDDRTPQAILSKAVFDIGGEDQLHKLREQVAAEQLMAAEPQQFDSQWATFLKDCHIKIGTLLKSDNTSFLIAAGASKHAGGVLFATIPQDIERQILADAIVEGKPKSWLKPFYLAIRQLVADANSVPITAEAVLKRQKTIDEAVEFRVNFEELLTLLHRWRAALPTSGGKLQIEGEPPVEATAAELDHCLNRTTAALAQRCVLPPDGNSKALQAHRTLLRKLLTRPLNLKRTNLFTLNYDTLIEQAADAEGIVLLDGFVGTIHRVFRPESYDQDLYFPAETTEGRVHRLDRVLHIYKLHGSINWASEAPDWNNPYGVRMKHDCAFDTDRVLIYPTPAKYAETLGMPYSELFRRFAAAITRPQSTLFVIGYGFGDEHVNAIIRQALAVPSFTLVIVDPYAPEPDAESDRFVAKLRSRKDRRVWTIAGEALGLFSAFVTDVLPDLRDEEILRQVMGTYRSLRPEAGIGPAGGEPDGK